MEKCVGCGYCCIKTPCIASIRLYPGAKECPALYWNNEKKMYRCSLMELPGDLGIAYRQELYAGAGCCSSLNSWRKDVKQRVKPTGFINPLSKEFQLFLKCLSSNFINSDLIRIAALSFKMKLLENNYDKQEAEVMYKEILKIFFDNRDSKIQEFMG